MTATESVDRAVLPHCVQVGTRIAAVDGRITAIDQVAGTGPADHLRGTLLPGFVDLQVNGAGGRTAPATVVGRDPATDIALLKINVNQ